MKKLAAFVVALLGFLMLSGCVVVPAYGPGYYSYGHGYYDRGYPYYTRGGYYRRGYSSYY
jgi:hypothetical protein